MILVGFSKPKNHKFPIFSWLIRLIEWTPYSHSFIRWSSSWLERDVVYEASGTMVHFVVGHKFDKKAETLALYEIHCSDEARRKLIQKAMDRSAAPYGMKQVFGILLVKLMRLFGKDIKNPFSDGSATWICSEVVMDALIELGITFDVHIDNVTPKDLKKGLDSKLGDRVKKII